VDDSLLSTSGRLIAILALVAMNGFFVAAEFALVTIRATRIDQLVEEGRAGAKAARAARGHLDTFIAACQLGITMASLALGWIAEPAMASLIEPPLEATLGIFAEAAAHTVAAITSFLIVTVLLVVAGELAPKGFALAAPERVALLVAPGTNLFATVFKPIIWFLNVSGWIVLRPFGIKPAGEHGPVSSIEELKLVVMASREAGLLDEHEQQMVNRVFTLSNLTAKQAMVPRTEILAVDVDSSLDELVDIVQQARHTRIPVYEGSIDNVIGVLNVKDLFAYLRDRSRPFPGSRRLMRPALLVPESTRLDELLTEMRRTRTQIAIVIDEFGGTAGIVTLENILERLVGDVQSELEAPETPEVVERPDGSFVIDGLMLIDDFNDQFGLRLEDDNYDTIGGYLFGKLGRRPEPGDEVTLPDGRTLQVEALDGLRIARVRVSPPLVTAGGEGS
jgi:CBS domain containing-hemolysin-like protein